MATGSVARSPDRFSRLPVQAITSGLTIALLHVAGISILLAAADAFALSPGELTTLIIGGHGLTAILTAALTWLFRVPIIIGMSAFSLLFVMSLAPSYSYPEIMGGILVGGILIVLAAVLGLSTRLTTLVPTPIVFGLIAGALLQFAVGIFNDMADEPAMIGSTVLAWLVARRFLPAQLPAVLPALVVGVLVAATSGMLRGATDPLALPAITTARPVFSWQAIISIAPVIAILVTANANLSTIVYLRSQGYEVPARGLHVMTGLATMVGACLGAIAICAGAVLMPLVAGPEAGAASQRHWAAYAAAAGMIPIVVFAALAAQMPAMIPVALLLAVAGLALLPILGQMLVGALGGPLRLGPLLAFVVAASDLTLWGFGAAFWALVIGTAATLLLEPQELAAARAPAVSG